MIQRPKHATDVASIWDATRISQSDQLNKHVSVVISQRNVTGTAAANVLIKHITQLIP